MTVKRRELKFRHPETVEHMQSLPEEEAEKHPTVVRGRDWAATHYWRSGARRRNGVFSEGSTKRDHCRSKNPLRLQSSTVTIFVGKTNAEIAGWEINNTAEAVGGQILHQLVREE